jgi:Tfp pilus assembly protein PilZ
MRSFKLQAMVIATAFIVVSCNQDMESEVTTDIAANKIQEQKNIAGEEEYRQQDSTGIPGQQPAKGKGITGNIANTPAGNPDWDRKIIRNADIAVEVKDQQAFYNSVRQKVREFGGYIASENQTQDDYKIENSLVIKVPVAQFDDALSVLNTGVIAVTQKKVSSQDVTTEMVDTRSRLETKKRVHKRYAELLGQAKNMEEMFAVEREVNKIQEDIEAADGRLNYLGHASAYSTINFTYFQVLDPVMKDKDEPGFGTKFKEAFASGLDWLGGLLLGLISIWPFLLLIGMVYVFFRKRWIKLIKL